MSAGTGTPEGTQNAELSAQPSYFRIFVAAINTDGHLVYADQVKDNGPFADTFTQLTDMSFDPTPLQASTTLDGYVSLLAQQADTQRLIYIAEDSDASASKRFDAPVDLGMPPSVTAFRDTELIGGLNGLPNVFGISADTDDTIWWTYANPYTIQTDTEQVTPPGTDTPIEVTVEVPVAPEQPWADWIQIPGELTSITATQNADGRLIIGGLNSAQRAYYDIQNSDHPDKAEGWAGWQDITGTIEGLEQLEMAIDGIGLVHIFGRAGPNLYMRVQTETGGTQFTDWMLFAGFETPLQDFAVGVSSNDGLYLTVQVGSGVGSPIYGIHQVGPEQSRWTAPRVIAFAQTDAQYLLQPNANTALSLFALNTDTKTIDYTTELRPNLWQAGWTQVGTDLVSMAITRDVTVASTPPS